MDEKREVDVVGDVVVSDVVSDGLGDTRDVIENGRASDFEGNMRRVRDITANSTLCMKFRGTGEGDEGCSGRRVGEESVGVVKEGGVEV